MRVPVDASGEFTVSLPTLAMLDTTHHLSRGVFFTTGQRVEARRRS